MIGELKEIGGVKLFSNPMLENEIEEELLKMRKTQNLEADQKFDYLSEEYKNLFRKWTNEMRGIK